MVIRTDIQLRGEPWNVVINNMKEIFSERTNYSIFLLALTIGIMYDKRIESFDDLGDEEKSVPRNVIRNNDNGKLDVCFQAAILSTSTENYSEEKRLELAFGDETDFNKIGFLSEFANYGVTKLEELIGGDVLETMENIKNFSAASVEGRNLEIDALPDDVFLFEE